MAAQDHDAKNEDPSDKPGNAGLLPAPDRRHKGPLSALEYEVAQLYRGWPKPRARKDN